MSLYKKIDKMSLRLIEETSNSRISDRIRLYSEGVKAKLKNAEYAFLKIKDYSSKNDNLTTTDNQDFTIRDIIQFYVDSFFACLYSTFDIISQVVNQKHGLNLNEEKVSFAKVKKELNQNNQNINIKRIYDKLSRKHFFRDLDKYRNCSTHRRPIYIESLARQGTPGYINTFGEYQEIYWIICDNPLSLNPETEKDRELGKYCDEILKKSEIRNNKNFRKHWSLKMQKTTKKQTSSKEQKQINSPFKIIVNPEVSRGVYSNVAAIQHTQNEFLIDFILKFGGDGQLVSRVILSPSHIMALLNALKTNIKDYENKFGEIKREKKNKPTIN